MCQLEDLAFRGYPFTWSNRRLGDANAKVRLDRAVATKEYRENYQLSTVTHLSSHASNFLPIILQTKSYRQHRQRRDKGFKFKESWLLWNECETVMKEAWNTTGNGESGLALIKEKISTCGVNLMAWGATKSNLNTKAIK